MIIDINEFVHQSTQFMKSLGNKIEIGGHNYLTLDSLLEKWNSTIDYSFPNQNIDVSFKK